MDNKFVLSDNFNEVVFEHRNKAYGAYQLRQRYGRQVMSAMLFSITLFGSAFFVFGSAPDAQAAVRKPVDDGIIFITPPELTPAELPKKEEELPKKIAPKPPAPQTPIASPQITSTIEVTTKPVAQVPTNTPGGNPNGEVGGLGGGPTPPGGECDDCPPALIPVTPPPQPPAPLDWVPEMPTNDGLHGYLSSNIRYPADARDRGDEGTVILEFVVNKDGSYRDIRVLRGVCPSIDREALRVAAKMPRWKPGKNNGVAVDVILRQPISFKLHH